MQIKIDRGDSVTKYNVPFKSTTLLSALYQIKQQIDNSLTFCSNCRSGI